MADKLFTIDVENLKQAVRASYDLRVNKCSVLAGDAYFDGFRAGIAACARAIFPDSPEFASGLSDEAYDQLADLLDDYIEAKWD